MFGTFVSILLLIVAFFDLYWILRLVITKILSRFRTRLRPDEKSVTYNICWTTDIDYFFHMNNGKYFREMDFGRFDFYFRSGLSDYMRGQEKMWVVQHGASIRYRRSIDFLVPFKLETKLVWWDDRSLYFEQRFISLHDGFVRAIALCKNTCIGGTVKEMFSSLQLPVTPSPVPEEIRLWIQSQEISSTKLRQDAPVPIQVDGEANIKTPTTVESNIKILANDDESTSVDTEKNIQGEWEVLDDKEKSKEV